MTARELFDEGRLADAIREQSLVVENRPEDFSARLLLCEFLAFDARFNTVIEQLEKFQASDDAFYAYIEGWREIALADKARHDGKEPAYLIPVPEHVEQTRKAVFAGDPDALDEAMEAMPLIEGHVDGREFEGCRDSDDSVAGEFEFFAEGETIRIPWEHLRKIRMEPVECLRDQLYRPTTITLTDGRKIEGFAPAHYVSTEVTPEELRCGMGTDYFEEEYGMRGHGARMILLGEEELTLAEFTQLELRVAR